MSENECCASWSATPNSCQLQSLPKVWIMFVSYVRQFIEFSHLVHEQEAFGELPSVLFAVLPSEWVMCRKCSSSFFYCFVNKIAKSSVYCGIIVNLKLWTFQFDCFHAVLLTKNKGKIYNALSQIHTLANDEHFHIMYCVFSLVLAKNRLNIFLTSNTSTKNTKYSKQTSNWIFMFIADAIHLLFIQYICYIYLKSIFNCLVNFCILPLTINSWEH